MADPIDCKDKVATKRTLAGAVAREIERIAQSGEHYGEGLAYKSFHDERGSDSSKHSWAFVQDASRMALDMDLSSKGHPAELRVRLFA